jgi:hypothetical protein
MLYTPPMTLKLKGLLIDEDPRRCDMKGQMRESKLGDLIVPCLVFKHQNALLQNSSSLPSILQ